MTGPAKPTARATAGLAALLIAGPALLTAPPVHSAEPATPAQAAEPRPDISQSMEDLSEAARKAVEAFVAALGPVMEGLQQMIEDMPRYEAPEVLPNGDIIIRRIPNEQTPPDEDDRHPDVTDL